MSKQTFMSETVRILSLGAGVQSSALLLMADRGEIPRVDFAVFADVQSEPSEVYSWLKKLSNAVRIEIVIATRGNIAQDVMNYFQGKLKRVGQPPLYSVLNGKNGILRRHCTKEYKIDVVNKAVRERLGYKPRQKMRHHIQTVMGISYDEMQRMKVPQEKWKSFDYPLVDMKLRREDCISYIEASGLGTPPRSACFFCPYKSDKEWKHLEESDPDNWKNAVEFDAKIRRAVTGGLSAEFFVHRSRKPLSEVDLSGGTENEYSMLDECDGMCGV